LKNTPPISCLLSAECDNFFRVDSSSAFITLFWLQSRAESSAVYLMLSIYILHWFPVLSSTVYLTQSIYCTGFQHLGISPPVISKATYFSK
jgi:hypothetical protein